MATHRTQDRAGKTKGEIMSKPRDAKKDEKKKPQKTLKEKKLAKQEKKKSSI